MAPSTLIDALPAEGIRNSTTAKSTAQFCRSQLQPPQEISIRPLHTHRFLPYFRSPSPTVIIPHSAALILWSHPHVVSTSPSNSPTLAEDIFADDIQPSALSALLSTLS